jgi:Ca-activated chloride channel family protein
MKFETNFTFDHVRYDQDNDTHLVVSLKAPKKDWQKERQQICILPVIDVSGSMHGDKLDYAKKSAIKLIEHLQPGDYAGLVAFSNDVELVSPIMEMTQQKKEELKVKVGDLHTIGCTNFSGGMIVGLDEINKVDIPSNVLLRVIMLTDGLANRGIAVEREDILNLLEQKLGAATLSAFGYGVGADQELLADMAKMANGNYAFIENPDDALSAFAKELGGLLSTYAQNIEVEVSANNGHKIQEVISDVDADGNESSVKIKLPEILSEEERQLVVKLNLSAQKKALPRAMSVVDVVVSYDVLNKDGEYSRKSETLKGKVKFVKKGEEQVSAHADVDKVVGLAEAMKAQIAAEEMANAGDFTRARLVLEDAAAGFTKRGLVGHANYTNTLKSKMANKAVYDLSLSYLSSTKSLGRRSYGTSSADSDAVKTFTKDFGLTKEAQSNEFQKTLTQKFVNDDSTNETKNQSSGGQCITPKEMNISIEPNITIIPGDIKVITTDKIKLDDSNKTEEEKSSILKKRSKRW